MDESAKETVPATHSTVGRGVGCGTQQLQIRCLAPRPSCAQAKLPEVDLMIRTGGDMRVSNFLLWQISYSEIWITEKCWPEFTREDFLNAICEFNSRQRRFGGLNVNE